MQSVGAEFGPVKACAFVLIGTGVWAPVLFFSPWSSSDLWPDGVPVGAIIFVVVVSAIHLWTGAAVLRRRRIGYHMLRGYLYCMIVAFPVGTVLAMLMLSYMKRHNIERYFGGGV